MELKGFKDKKLNWDEKGALIVNDVLAVLWMDNGPVTMLTTIHSLTRERRKHRTTNINAVKVRSIFGDSSRKMLEIPCLIIPFAH